MDALRTMNPVVLVLGASTFVAVIAVWSILILIVSRREKVTRLKLKERLSAAGVELSGLVHQGSGRTLRLWYEGKLATATVDDSVVSLPWSVRLERFGADAGWKLPAKTVLCLLLLAIVGIGAVSSLIAGRIVVGIMASATTAMIFWWNTNRLVAKHRGLFERQLVDALELSARALRAGHPLMGSFQLIALEIPPPVGTIFSDICQEQDMGVPLDESLRKAAAVSKNEDMKLFTASMAINVKTGGSLSEVVEGLANIIRDRMRLSRRFRVLIAQTEVSKRILIGLPIFMFGVMTFIRPEYMDVFYSTFRGQMMLLCATGMLLMGWWVMNKMSSLKT